MTSWGKGATRTHSSGGFGTRNVPFGGLTWNVFRRFCMRPTFATFPVHQEAPMSTKLRLDPETLRVESFAATEEGGGRGTVRGHGYTEPDYPSCARTCGATPPP